MSVGRSVRLPGPIDLGRTLSRMSLFGRDPTQGPVDGGYVCAFRTEEGPATIRYRQVSERDVEAEAWGPGADRALANAPAHLGGDDRPESFQPDCAILGPLARRRRGIRFGRAPRVFERLVPVILSQKVTGKGAIRSFRQLLREHGEPAPGPGLGLWLVPTVERFRELAYYDFHPLGIEQKRARVVLEVVRRARRIERLAETSPEVAHATLMKLPGIGPWTAGHVVSTVFGDPDAVPVGDYHLPNMVAFAFTGEPRGTDAQMLELLEPFRPHRGRALALLKQGGHGAPRFGPRLPVRDIRDH